MSLKKESQELNEKEGKDQYKKHDFITGENSFSCSQTAKTQTRGLHGGPETRGPGTRPGTRTGSGLYFKRSAGSGSGPNLLLRVPGLFNFVCNTRVDRRTPHPRVISVSQHACV